MSFDKASYPRFLPGSGQKATAGASSAQLTAFNAETRILLITATTANVRIELGPNPTATATSFLVKTTDPALFIGCSGGDKLAYIQDSAGGVINVSELTY